MIQQVQIDPLGTTNEYLVEQANKALFQTYKLSGPTVGFEVVDSQIMLIREYG